MQIRMTDAEVIAILQRYMDDTFKPESKPRIVSVDREYQENAHGRFVVTAVDDVLTPPKPEPAGGEQ